MIPSLWNQTKKRFAKPKVVSTLISTWERFPPKVGGRYLLFLTRDVQTPDDTGKDFHILTGYELRDGRVHLLDDTLPGHPITRYKGNTETTLLTDLFNTVAKTSNLSN